MLKARNQPWFFPFPSFCLISFWPCLKARGILVPWPGIEPTSPAVEAQSPYYWTARESPWNSFFPFSMPLPQSKLTLFLKNVYQIPSFTFLKPFATSHWSEDQNSNSLWGTVRPCLLLQPFLSLTPHIHYIDLFPCSSMSIPAPSLGLCTWPYLWL